ncbi:hypothetical protein GRI89_01575 [Altererythrobacter salegens]|uniref:Ferredoxin n=1 Tax=Croceibacterium salegens TaxID=1737568 RepID=A0A6I4SQX9_9SPHN|nr:ferredoxin [Croceibacterium salegens]MXO58234.1 hypothetical protein [Croceibacterium salegens]
MRPETRKPPHPANVPGPFYVELDHCTLCTMCEFAAPDLFALVDEVLGAWYVSKQPASKAEFGRMKEAMRDCEVDCIRVKNCPPDWAARLRDAGMGGLIDSVEGEG